MADLLIAALDRNPDQPAMYLGEHVLMEGRLQARGRSSGLEVQEEMAWLHTFRNGTGAGRYLRFPNRTEALEAAGLRE